MAKIGYARVSSKEQHLDRQLAALKDVDKLFTDKLSGANTNRPELQKMGPLDQIMKMIPGMANNPQLKNLHPVTPPLTLRKPFWQLHQLF